MSVPLYMDHHVKAAVTDGLRKRGVDVLTCAEDGTDQSDDDEILQRVACRFAWRMAKSAHSKHLDLVSISRFII